MTRSARSRHAVSSPDPDPRPAVPPGTATTPASSKTAACGGRRSAGPRPSPHLQPYPRLGNPRPVSPPVPGPPRVFGLGDRPPGRPLRAVIAHRGQPAVHHIRADLPAAAVHQLLHLAGELIDAARPPQAGSRISPGLPQCYVPQHGLTVRAGQLRRRMRAASQVNASRISMISLPDLVTDPSGR